MNILLKATKITTFSTCSKSYQILVCLIAKKNKNIKILLAFMKNLKLVPKAITESLSGLLACHWSILSIFHLSLDAVKIRLEEYVTTRCGTVYGITAGFRSKFYSNSQLSAWKAEINLLKRVPKRIFIISNCFHCSHEQANTLYLIFLRIKDTTKFQNTSAY